MVTVKIEVPYGKSSMPLELKEDRLIDVASPREAPVDESSLVASLSNPIKSRDLVSFLSERRKILVVINDYTRPTPTSTVLKSLDLKGKEVTTIVASGAHRPPSARELEQMLGGPRPPYGGRVVLHNSADESQLRSIGHTSRGTELQFNKQLFEADGIIVVGSVEPHYCAGFTGGRKFLLPGLAGFTSIETNHSLALDERATILRLEGNPLHEDFMEALDIFDRYDDIFSIQLVLNRDHQISYALSGHIVESFSSAVNRAKEIYIVSIDTKADIIVSVAKPPMDLDLYQAHKAIENVKPALKDQGVLILVSACPDGIGLRNFYDLLAYGGSVNAFNITKDKYRLGDHKAARLAQLLKEARLFGVTNLAPGTARAAGITPYEDVQSAVDEAIRLKGSGSRILVVLDGCLTVPVPKN